MTPKANFQVLLHPVSVLGSPSVSSSEICTSGAQNDLRQHICIFLACSLSLLRSLHILSRHGDQTRQVTRVSCSMRQSQALETSSYLSAGDDVNESVVESREVCSQSMYC